jgi:hypothetical protein
MATIQTIQIEAGISMSVFKNTIPLEYVNWSWTIMSIRDFLQHINAQIIGIPIIITPRHRENDSHIMEALAQNNRFSTKEVQQIQACRLHMQVTALSEITDATGGQIRDDWIYPDKTHSKSKWIWPRQPAPGKAAWSTWRQFLKTTFTNSYFRLKRPLGKWINVPNRDYKQMYDHTSETLFVRTMEQWVTYKLTCTRRRSLEFHLTRQPAISTIPAYSVPVDIVRHEDDIIITTKPAKLISHIREQTVEHDHITEHIVHFFPKYLHLHHQVDWATDPQGLTEGLYARRTIHIATDGG